MTITEVKCIGRYRKWFWISKFHDKKRDILLSGMTLSGTHCTCTSLVYVVPSWPFSYAHVYMYRYEQPTVEGLKEDNLGNKMLQVNKMLYMYMYSGMSVIWTSVIWTRQSTERPSQSDHVQIWHCTCFLMNTGHGCYVFSNRTHSDSVLPHSIVGSLAFLCCGHL